MSHPHESPSGYVVVEGFIKMRYKVALVLMVNLIFCEYGKVMHSIVVWRAEGIPQEVLDLLRLDFKFPYSLLFGAVMILPPMAAGRLAELCSARWMLFALILLANIGTLLKPLAAETIREEIVMDVLFVNMYFFNGCYLPITHVLLSRWAPPDERFVMGTLVYSGIPLGTAVAAFLTTWVTTMASWESIFYGSAILNIVFLIPWLVVVRDDPSKHGGITERETDYLKTSLEDELYDHKSRRKSKLPWKAMFSSSAFWAALVIHLNHTYAWSMFEKEFSIQARYFMKADVMPPINQSVVIAMPIIWIANLMWSFSLAVFNLLLHDVITLLQVYRYGSIITLAGTLLNIPNYYYQEQLKEYNVTLNSTLILLMFGYWSASMIITLDIAPNYAGTMLGFFNTIGSLPNFVFSNPLRNIPDLKLMESAFGVAMFIVASLIGIVYCSPELQPWNNHSHLLKQDIDVEIDGVSSESTVESDPASEIANRKGSKITPSIITPRLSPSQKPSRASTRAPSPKPSRKISLLG